MSVWGWKGRQERSCYSLDSQTVTSFSLIPLVYSCMPSLKRDAILVILALNGVLQSSPTGASKRTDIVLASCISLTTGESQTTPLSNCMGWCGNETECTSLEQWALRRRGSECPFLHLVLRQHPIPNPAGRMGCIGQNTWH